MPAPPSEPGLHGFPRWDTRAATFARTRFRSSPSRSTALEKSAQFGTERARYVLLLEAHCTTHALAAMLQPFVGAACSMARAVLWAGAGGLRCRFSRERSPQLPSYFSSVAW